nr:tyrosine-protein kinase receptor Tie-1-like [Hydra vulgaris]
MLILKLNTANFFNFCNFFVGATPYPAISNRELFYLLKAGYRMDKPENCSETMYDVMLQCWHENPLQRPTFATLREYFDKVISEVGCYLNFELNENTTPSFLPYEIDNHDDNTIEDRVLQNPVRVKSIEEIKKNR